MAHRATSIDLARLEAAYVAWPGSEHEKTTQKALLLRLRIEDVIRRLPRTVIAAGPDSDRARQRLMLTVGEPGLNAEQRAERIAVIRNAIATYEAICQVLHGRDPEGRPPLTDVTTWEQTVIRLESELAVSPAVPRQPAGGADDAHVHKRQS